MSGVLSVSGVEKGFSRGGQWTPVLREISLEVLPGEIAAVIGGRLEGKTTLLKLAAGIERPDKGSIQLDGKEITGARDRKLSKLLGREIVWIDRQGPALDITIARYVGWPLTLHGHGRRHAEGAAQQALQRVGAQTCAHRHWPELSNPQRVLVGLARAFVATPKLIVIDDLLDALNPTDTEQTADLLRTLIQETKPQASILMSASNLESAIYADHIWTLTRKHTLKNIGREPGNVGNVVPFPDRDSSRARGSRGVGCP